MFFATFEHHSGDVDRDLAMWQSSLLRQINKSLESVHDLILSSTATSPCLVSNLNNAFIFINYARRAQQEQLMLIYDTACASCSRGARDINGLATKL